MPHAITNFHSAIQRWETIPTLPNPNGIWGYGKLDDNLGLYAPCPHPWQSAWRAPWVALIDHGEPIVIYLPNAWILGSIDVSAERLALFAEYTTFRVAHNGGSFLAHPADGLTSTWRQRRREGAWEGGANRIPWHFGAECIVKYERPT